MFWNPPVSAGGFTMAAVVHIFNVERFKPETVAKVREIAAELGYQANIMALSLRAPHPSFFGLILRGSGVADAISWHHLAFEGQFLAGAPRMREKSVELREIDLAVLGFGFAPV